MFKPRDLILSLIPNKIFVERIRHFTIKDYVSLFFLYAVFLFFAVLLSTRNFILSFLLAFAFTFFFPIILLVLILGFSIAGFYYLTLRRIYLSERDHVAMVFFSHIPLLTLAFLFFLSSFLIDSFGYKWSYLGKVLWDAAFVITAGFSFFNLSKYALLAEEEIKPIVAITYSFLSSFSLWLCFVILFSLQLVL